jgi:hypothetical protein
MEQIMAAEVGGRLEAIPPHRSLFGQDYARLISLFAIAIAIHAWLITHTAITARDSTGYARVALNMLNPSAGGNGEQRQFIDVIRTAEQPPGYPLAILAVEKLLRPFNMPVPDRFLLAAQLANAIGAILLVVPMYLTGRILFGRNVGFAATLLFQVLPVPARMTSDGLSEGVYLLIVATAIVLAVRTFRQPRIGGFLLCGLATGLSYLVRPEGLGVGIAVSAVIVWMGLKRRWPRDQALGRLCALMVGVALVGLPYMLLIGKLSNKPTTLDILNPLNHNRGRIWMLQQDVRSVDLPGNNAALFAVWWDPVRDAGKNRHLWSLHAVWSESIKSLHYIIGGLALIGIFARRRQLFSPDLGMWFLIALGILNLVLMFYLAERIQYISERHTLLFVMLSCIFAASALKPIAQFISSLPMLGRLVIWPKTAPGGLLFAIALSTLPFTLQPMHAQREGHKHAGRWLAKEIKEGDWLIDPLCWAEWYAGKTLYKTPSYDGQPTVKWVVVEEGKKDDSANPHSRIPQWEHANQEIKKGVKVYSWPEKPNGKFPTVCVYKIIVDQPNNAPPPQPAPTPQEKNVPGTRP